MTASPSLAATAKPCSESMSVMPPISLAKKAATSMRA